MEAIAAWIRGLSCFAMSAGRSSATGGRRRRRSPEVAEREIIDAAEELLRERPFRELTVDEVMRRTELSRPSFYVYFRDRHHLVLKVVERLTARERRDGRRLVRRRGLDGREVIREATAGVVDVFERHGAVLQALADAAADDPDVEAAYRGVSELLHRRHRPHIEREIEAGNMLPCNARETARALSIMNERYLTAVLGRNPTVEPESSSTRSRRSGCARSTARPPSRDLRGRQCLKCRRCVKTIEMPAASAASTTSGRAWSRPAG